MKNNLINLADYFDSKGLTNEADFVDFMIRKVSQELDAEETEAHNSPLIGHEDPTEVVGEEALSPGEDDIVMAFNEGETSPVIASKDLNRFIIDLLYKVLSSGTLNFRMVDKYVEDLKKFNPTLKELRESILESASHIGALVDMLSLYKLEVASSEETLKQIPEEVSGEAALPLTWQEIAEQRRIQDIGGEPVAEGVFDKIDFEEFYSNRVGAMAMAGQMLFEEYNEERYGLPESYGPSV